MAGHSVTTPDKRQNLVLTATPDHGLNPNIRAAFQEVNPYFVDCLERWGMTWLKEPPATNGTTLAQMGSYNDLFEIVEMLWADSSQKSDSSRITLFEFDDHYGYAVAVWNSDSEGQSWTPCVQCQPYPSLIEARDAGIAKFLEIAKSKRLRTWAEALQAPQQMTLF